MQWNIAAIAFRCIDNDEIIISAKFNFETNKMRSMDGVCGIQNALHLQLIPKLIDCLQNWMCIHQYLIQAICGQLKVALPRNRPFNYGHGKVKHIGHHVLQTQSFSILGISTVEFDYIFSSLGIHAIDHRETLWPVILFYRSNVLSRCRFSVVRKSCCKSIKRTAMSTASVSLILCFGSKR